MSGARTNREPVFSHQPAEQYVKASHLAMLMGVSTSTIKRWTAAGMPSETWGLGNTRRYLFSACKDWAREREQGTVNPEPAPRMRGLRMTTARPDQQRE